MRESVSTRTVAPVLPSELRSCVKVEVAVLAWDSVPDKPTGSVDVIIIMEICKAPTLRLKALK